MSRTTASSFSTIFSEDVPQDVTAKKQYLSSWKLRIVITSLSFIVFLVALDVNVIGSAVPKIISKFDSLDEIGWYKTTYLLPLSALQIPFGTIYKLFNIKTTYIASISLFESISSPVIDSRELCLHIKAGSILCAASSNSSTLVAGRAITGIGAAGILQGALAIIGQLADLTHVPLYSGIIGAFLGIGAYMIPILGSLFTDHVTWRWCFWINLPIAEVFGASILHLMKKGPLDCSIRLRVPTFGRKSLIFDLTNTATLAGGVCCLLLALQWMGQTLPQIFGQFIGLCLDCSLCLIFFEFLQWKYREVPTVSLRIIRQRSVLNGSCFLFFLGMSSSAYSFYIPLFFQAVQKTSATESGARIIAYAVPQITHVVIGVLVTKHGFNVPYMILGSAIAAVGAGLMSMFDTDISTAKWASYLALTGFGTGICMQLPYTAAQLVLSGDDILLGNGVLMFAWQFGSALGLAICQMLFIGTVKAKVSTEFPSIPTGAVIISGTSGAGNLTSLTGDPMVLQRLRNLYSDGIHKALVLALVAAALSVPFACMMERLNVKEVDTQRKECVKSENEAGV